MTVDAREMRGGEAVGDYRGADREADDILDRRLGDLL